jgi:phage-related minor tail protein
VTEPIGYVPLQVIPTLKGLSGMLDKELGGLKGMGRAVGKQLGDGIASGVETATKRVEQSTSKIQSLRDKEAAAADKVVAAEARIEEVREKGGSALKRAEAQRNAAQRAQAAALRDIERETKSLTTAQEQLSKAQEDASKGPSAGPAAGSWMDRLKAKASEAKESLRGLGEGVSEAGGEAGAGFVEGFGGKIGALGSKGGAVGVALAAAAALGLGAGAALADQVLAGFDTKRGIGLVQAKLGVDEVTMKTIADAAGKAYAGNFGESLESNLDTARAAIQSGLIGSDASAEDMAALIGQLDTVSNVLGEDVPAAARAAQQAVTTGLAPNATAAFDLIVKGQQNGLNVSEDWLDTLNEYGTQFRKLGLDGPEAMGLLSQAVKAGARDTDVAADALKEFSIRAIDGSEATGDAYTKLGYDNQQMLDIMNALAGGGKPAHDALGKVLTDIRNLKDPLQQSQVAVGLFGTQAEDLGAAFNSFDLSTATTQFGNVAGAAQKAADAAGGGAANSIETLRRSVETSISGMQLKLADAFGPFVTEWAQSLSSHQGQITGFFVTVGAVGTKAVGGILIAVGEFLSGLSNINNAVADFVKVVTNGFGATLTAAAAVADAFGAGGVAANIRGFRDEINGVADNFQKVTENTIRVSDAIKDAGSDIYHSMDGAQANMAATAQQAERIKTAIEGIPGAKTIDVDAIVVFKDPSGKVIPDGFVTPRREAAVPGEAPLKIGGGRAGGGKVDPSGRISGPGTGTSDSILAAVMGGDGGFIKVSNTESINTAWSTRANWDVIEAMNAGANLSGWLKVLPGFATGGAVSGPDVAAAEKRVGTPYSKGKRNDCSGSVAQVINDALDMDGGLMTTKNAREWLAARGFVEGSGGPGQIRVGWYDHGPGQNDGHMAMTLSDGRNAESGGSVGAFTIGGGAAGADSAQFDQHMYLPTVYGEGPATGGGGFDFIATATGGGAPSSSTSSAGSSSSDGSGSGGGGGGFNLPTSFSGLATMGLDALNLKTKSTPESPDRSFDLGNAIGAAVTGQMDSAFDVLGVDGAPQWLDGVGKLVQFGMGLGGVDVSAAAPLAAAPSIGAAALPPDDVHGSRAGQAPGPQTVYNIQTATVEDAFLAAQRKANEQRLSKVARY